MSDKTIVRTRIFKFHAEEKVMCAPPTILEAEAAIDVTFSDGTREVPEGIQVRHIRSAAIGTPFPGKSPEDFDAPTVCIFNDFCSIDRQKFVPQIHPVELETRHVPEIFVHIANGMCPGEHTAHFAGGCIGKTEIPDRIGEKIFIGDHGIAVA